MFVIVLLSLILAAQSIFWAKLYPSIRRM